LRWGSKSGQGIRAPFNEVTVIKTEGIQCMAQGGEYVSRKVEFLKGCVSEHQAGEVAEFER
jgi:hypothetical protein